MLPLVLVLLLFVFGSVLAAVLPLVVGLLAVTAGLAGAGLLARVTPMSIYATNVMTMIGLGVAIDYSLFIVSRFREEVRHRPVPEAISVTLATAGHAVVFAGATVAVGSSAWRSSASRTSAPWGTRARSWWLLRALQRHLPARAARHPRSAHRRRRVPFLRTTPSARERGVLAPPRGVRDAAPWGVLVPVTLFLLLLGIAVPHIRLGSGDATSLPDTAPSRRGEEILRAQFPGTNLNTIVVVVDAPDGEPLRPDRVDALYELSRWLAAPAPRGPRAESRRSRSGHPAAAVPAALQRAARAVPARHPDGAEPDVGSATWSS